MKIQRLSSAIGYLLSLTFLFLFTPNLFSQNLIVEAAYPTTELTADQLEKFNAFQNDESVADVKFVNFGDLETLQEDGVLELSLPGLDCTPTIRAKDVEAKANGDYFWYGEVDNSCLFMDDEEECFCFDGAVSLLSKNGDIFGTLQIDDAFFELFSLGAGKTVLIKRAENMVLECGNSDDVLVAKDDQDALLNNSTLDLHLEGRNFDDCLVKVLAVFTPAASEAVSNPEAVIEMTINNTNLAFRKSAIPNTQLNLELVHTQLFNFTESPAHRDDLDTLVANSTLQNLRDSVNADIILVFTNNSYTVAGIAGTLFLDSERALSLIEIETANWNHIGSHEIGHLFSCRHHIEADTIGEYEHAHDFKIKKFLFKWERRTIMWAGAGNGAILRFSNPDVKYGGKATGTEETENNVKKLFETGCTVANFRGSDENEPISASITTSGFACSCVPTTIHSTIQSSSGPVTYEWLTSTDGFNFGPVVSTTAFVQVNMPCAVGEGIFLKLKVTDPTGEAEVIEFVESALTWPGQAGECSDQFINPNNGNTINSELNNPDLIAYPNPSSDIFSIFIKKEIPKGKKVVYQIMDRNGKAIISSQSASNQFQFDLRENPPGIYLLFVQIDGETLSQKIIKI